MSIEQKNNLKLSDLRMRGTSSRRLGLSLLASALILSGCASSPITIAPDCPQPAPIPAALSASDLESASDFSERVQSYLARVQSFLAE